MPLVSLDEDATIADIAGKLNKRMEYVRQVLENMWDCQRQHGSASVRIGIMGGGRAPNYRTEYTKEGLSFPAVFSVYNGLSHKKMEGLGQWNVNLEKVFGDPWINEKPPEHSVKFDHWSKRTMNFTEVAAVLGELRKRRS